MFSFGGGEEQLSTKRYKTLKGTRLRFGKVKDSRTELLPRDLEEVLPQLAEKLEETLLKVSIT